MQKKYKAVSIFFLVLAASPLHANPDPCEKRKDLLKRYAEMAAANGGEISGYERLRSDGDQASVETTIRRVATQKLSPRESSLVLDDVNPCSDAHSY